jgi:hypothetical protein
LHTEMYRLVCGLFAATLVAAPLAQAEEHCTNPTDQSAFELEALKSELMVLATGCHADAQYNAFMNRYKPELIANERAFDDYFKRAYGSRKAQREHDTYITSLANAQSDVGLKQGSDFCPRNGAVFDEVMALQKADQLPQYAAGKDVVPASLGTCTTLPAAPAVKTRAHRPAAK